MKITMLETVKHDGQTYEDGEQRVVSEAVGSYFCGHGWASSDEAPTGDRKPGAVTLSPETVTSLQQ